MYINILCIPQSQNYIALLQLLFSIHKGKYFVHKKDIDGLNSILIIIVCTVGSAL